MKAYSFNLENLLLLRTQSADLAFQKWAKAVQNLQQVLQEKKRIERQLQAWQDEQRTLQATTIRAGDLFRSHQSLLVFQRLLQGQDQLRQIMDQQVQQTLKDWTEIHRKQEILERLKKRSWERWVQESERQDQRLNDERATILAYQNTGRNPFAHAA